MNSENKKRYLVYARESERDINGVPKGISANDQKQECIRHVEIIGGEVATVFMDMNRTGKTILDYYKCLYDKFDGIVVYDLTCLSSSVKDLMKIMEVFKEDGKEIISVIEKIDFNSPIGRAGMLMMAVSRECMESIYNPEKRSA